MTGVPSMAMAYCDRGANSRSVMLAFTTRTTQSEVLARLRASMFMGHLPRWIENLELNSGGPGGFGCSYLEPLNGGSPTRAKRKIDQRTENIN